MLMVVLIASATKIASEIYAPSLLLIARQLPGATINMVQLSFSIFLLGVAVAQLIFGPLSEGIGRKRTLLIGLLILGFGSVLCAIAPSIYTLLVGRLVQGCGASALYALWRAILRDISHGEDLAKRGASLMVFMMGCGSLAPVLGGYLTSISWRASFWCMVLYVMVTAVLLSTGYEESNSHYHLKRLQWSYIKGTYARLLGDRVFLGLALCMFLSFSSVFVWLLVAPVLLMHYCHLSSVWFGWLIAAAATTGFAAGAALNNRYVRYVGMSSMMYRGWSIMWLGGVAMLLGFYMLGVVVWAIVPPMVVFYIGSMMVWPNAFAIAFAPYGRIAGYAGSLYGMIQLGGGACIGAMASQFTDIDQRPIALLMIITTSASVWLYRQWIYPAMKHNPEFGLEFDCQTP
jgi:Bcr/CflA subfamily drug resistance transporter